MDRLRNEIKQLSFVIEQISYKENKRKIDETHLGLLWNIINPLLYLLVLTTFYKKVVVHDYDYPVFVFIGLLIMKFYSDGTMSAMRSLVLNKQLLVKSKLSIGVFIVEKVFISIKDLFFSSIALIPIMIAFHVKIHLRTLLIIPVLFLTVAVVIGIGTILAIIYVYFEDIGYLYTIIMSVMVFVSGVFMPIERMPEYVQPILAINPIFLSIYISRNCLMYNLPSYWTAWVKLILWAISTMTIGLVLLKKNKNKIMNLI